MRGKPVILNNCEDHIDNIITPLMHHRNTANPKDEDEGKPPSTQLSVNRCVENQPQSPLSDPLLCLC